MLPVPPRPEPGTPASSVPVPPVPEPEPAAAPAAPGPVMLEPFVAEAGGGLRLFRVAGVDVHVHFTWFIAALFVLHDGPSGYSSLAWPVAAYLTGFAIILLHEFGHVFACRWVGGTADRVILWPLGGLAVVSPPPRPGAQAVMTLAGPLVNLILAPVLIALAFALAPATDDAPRTDEEMFVTSLAWFNLIVLVFNLLPLFPLDGGRLLHALLWRWLGRSTGLAVAAGVGVLGGACLCALALGTGEWWLALMAAFLTLAAFSGVRLSSQYARMERAERRAGWACPNCGAAPPVGEFWRCGRCFGQFDLFRPDACAKGGDHAPLQSCPECHYKFASARWVQPPDSSPHAPGSA